MASSSLYGRCCCALAFFALAGCPAAAPVATPPAPPVQPDYYTYEVVNTYPHDRGAFTEGLVFLNGHLFESTGLKGHSDLRETDLITGKVLRSVPVDSAYFGEGLAIIGPKAYQLTWQTHKGFVYDLASFKQEKTFTYTGEGWGLTTDGKLLIMSDGTSQIRFLDPATFEVKRTLDVRKDGQPIKMVNELEYIQGEIYANVWQTNYIVRIDPQTGNVVGVINLADILALTDYAANTDVLNGIAYDSAHDRLFVTGKYWPKIYEIKLHRLQAAGSPRS